MQCYTVTTTGVTDGLCALEREGRWVLRIGFAPQVEVPLPGRRQAGLKRFMDALRARAAGVTKFMSIIDADDKVSVEAAKSAVLEVEHDGLYIQNLDWAEGELVDSNPVTKAGSAALLHVAVCVNKDEGKLEYFSDNADVIQELVEGRVKRHYFPHSFKQSEGIEVCAQGLGFFGETQSLLRMAPGAAFRLRQSNPQPGAWEEIILRWTGFNLRSRCSPREESV